MSGQNWEQIANRVSKLWGKFVPTQAVKSNAYLLTHLLTNSMEQIPSWEANRFSASQ